MFVGLALGLCLPFALRGADEKKMTVVDYFLLLPDKTLEAPPRAWLGNAQVIDKQNGYISIAGDIVSGRAVSLSRSRTRGTPRALLR